MYARSSSLKMRHLPSSGVRKWHLVCSEKRGENLYPSRGEVSGGCEAPAFRPADLEGKASSARRRPCRGAPRPGGRGSPSTDGGAAPGITELRSSKRGERASRGEAEEIWSGMPSTEAFRENRLSPTREGRRGRQGRREGAATFVNFSWRGSRRL